MIRIKDWSILLSIIPAIPIIGNGYFFAFNGLDLVDLEQFAQFVIWVLGACGGGGLILASLEGTYSLRYARLVSLYLILCGLFAVLLSAYFVFTDFKDLGYQDELSDKAFSVYITILILLLWPTFGGIKATKLLLQR